MCAIDALGIAAMTGRPVTIRSAEPGTGNPVTVAVPPGRGRTAWQPRGASLYARTIQGRRAMRIAGLVAGYLAVWAAAGVPAYGLAWLAGWLTGKHPSIADAIFAARPGAHISTPSALPFGCP